MRLKPYLQLVRLPNVFTAAADSLAGWLLVTGGFADWKSWLPLVFASACTYAGGIALNDVFDAEVDRVERPSRPIPSGRISRRTAAWLGSILMALGLMLAIAARTRWGWLIEGLLIGCVLLYDTTGKRTALGPEVMGACRSLNFLLGMTGAASLGGPVGLMAALSYGLFVSGITWISRSEAEAGRWGNIALGWALQWAALLGMILTALMWNLSLRVNMDGSQSDVINVSWGVAFLLILSLFNGQRVLAALQRPEPPVIQRAVKFGIMSLVWLHVGLLLAVRGPVPAVAVALFWIPAAYAGRWIYST